MIEQIYGLIKNCFFFISFLLLVLIIYLYWNQNNMIYMPEVPNMCSRDSNENPFGYQNPQQQNMQYENLKITTNDKINLHGWFIKQADHLKRPTIIYFHENAGNIGFRIPLIKNLYELLKVNIVIVSYRGYGFSEGSPSESGIMMDSEAILMYVLKDMSEKINKNDVYILGRSLGGAVGIYITSFLKPNIKGLIIENTFTSMSDLIDKIFPFLKHLKGFMLKNHWPSKDRINQIKVPLMLYMSGKDELIPLSHMEELYFKATSAKFRSKLLIQDGTHNESWIKAGKKYFEHFGLFMKKCGSNMDSIGLDLELSDAIEDFSYSDSNINENETSTFLDREYNSINDVNDQSIIHETNDQNHDYENNNNNNACDKNDCNKFEQLLETENNLLVGNKKNK